MSKKIIGGVLVGAAFVALTVATGGASGFAASWLGGLAGSIGGTLAGVGVGISVAAWGGALIAGGLLGGALAGLSSLLGPKGFAVTDLAKNTSIRSDPAASRQIAYGQTATAGQLIFRDESGDDNEILHMVLVLAASEIDSLVSMTLNGDTITLPGGAGGNVTSGNFANKLQVYFHDGSDTTSPFSGSSISSLSRWTAQTRKLHGLAAIYIKATIDEDFEGKFEPMFTIKGRKIYDPRLDTTMGGSGTHRIDDPDTWAWSANPILQTRDYAAGIVVNGVTIGGMSRPAAEFDFDDLMAEANVCDEDVNLDAGGTENRYESHGFLDLGRPHRENLNAISSAMAGRWTWAAGKWRFYAGAFRTPVTVLSGAEMNGVPSRYRRFTGQYDRINTIRGSFRDARQNYEVSAYPTIVDASAKTADGETLSTDLNLPMTTSHTMAQRIAKIALKRSRAQKQLSASFNHKAINALPGEILTMTYPGFNLDGETMLIEKWDLAAIQDNAGNLGLGVNLDFIEERAEWYDWDESTEEQALGTSDTLGGAAGAYPWAKIYGTTKPEDNATDNSSALTGTVLNASVVQAQQADGASRNLGQGVASGEANDGDVFSFSTAWGSIPIVKFLAGGRSAASGLGDNVSQEFQAQNVSVSGFTASLKLVEPPSSPSNEVDGDGSGTENAWGGGHGDPPWRAGKESALSSYNNQYTFFFDVTVPPAVYYSGWGYIPGSITLGFYIFDGSTFVKRGDKTFTNNTLAPVDLNNQTHVITLSGLTTQADGSGDTYAVDIESSIGTGAAIDDVVKVTYTTAGTPGGSVSATGSGYSPVPFIIIGNQESGV